MFKNIEKEYKLLVSKSEFDHLLSFYKDAVFHEQTNTYFDNHQHAIETMHGAMRIRKTNHFVFTLKVFQDDDLLEFECEVDNDDVSSLLHPDIATLLKSYQIEYPFYETAKLTTKRAIIDTGFAELCFDENHYANCVDYEIEYEEKVTHDGKSAFNKILEVANLHYETNATSKIKRALDAYRNK
ncbi:MAG: CYTH domain-containing protein [Erysipelotrichaceae bacterium]